MSAAVAIAFVLASIIIGIGIGLAFVTLIFFLLTLGGFFRGITPAAAAPVEIEFPSQQIFNKLRVKAQCRHGGHKIASGFRLGGFKHGLAIFLGLLERLLRGCLGLLPRVFVLAVLKRLLCGFLCRFERVYRSGFSFTVSLRRGMHRCRIGFLGCRQHRNLFVRQAFKQGREVPVHAEGFSDDVRQIAHAHIGILGYRIFHADPLAVRQIADQQIPSGRQSKAFRNLRHFVRYVGRVYGAFKAQRGQRFLRLRLNIGNQVFFHVAVRCDHDGGLRICRGQIALGRQSADQLVHCVFIGHACHVIIDRDLCAIIVERRYAQHDVAFYCQLYAGVHVQRYIADSFRIQSGFCSVLLCG